MLVRLLPCAEETGNRCVLLMSASPRGLGVLKDAGWLLRFPSGTARALLLVLGKAEYWQLFYDAKRCQSLGCTGQCCLENCPLHRSQPNANDMSQEKVDLAPHECASVSLVAGGAGR